MDLAEARSGPHRPLRELLHLLGVLPGGQLGGIGDEGEDLVGRPRDLNRSARHGATLRRPRGARKDPPRPLGASARATTPTALNAPSSRFAGQPRYRYGRVATARERLGDSVGMIEEERSPVLQRAVSRSRRPPRREACPRRSTKTQGGPWGRGLSAGDERMDSPGGARRG